MGWRSGPRAGLEAVLGVCLAAGLASGCGADGTNGATAWAPAFEAERVGWLMNAWGPSGTDTLYAVGGTPEEGTVLRFDGEQWSTMALGLDVPLLNWTFGFSPDHVIAVGNEGTVLRWDGGEWNREATPTEQNLWGVWGSSPDSIWAVGGDGGSSGEPTILHYDGEQWSLHPVPALQRPQVGAFFKVWGAGPNAVWAVGENGAILRWNGSAWQERGAGTSRDLIALWGTGPQHVVAVGGRGNGVAALWDGEQWRSRSLSPLPGLNGVWMRREDVAHVVGVRGTIAELDPFELSYTEVDVDTERTFHAVFGNDRGRLTAVGGNLEMPMGPYRGVAYTRQLGMAR